MRLFFGAIGALLLMTTDLSAATTYKIMKADLKTDTSLGTFVSNGTTFGFITGIGYTLETTNDAGQKTRFSSDFWLNTPRNDLPTLNQLKAAIKADAISKNAKQKMDVDLAKAAVDSQPFIPVFGEDAGL